jgi:hypothetical protein
VEQDVFRTKFPQNSRYPRIMARGWESKSIEAQQEEASKSRERRPVLSEGERIFLERRRTLELARIRTAADLARATAPSHRLMLEQALATLEDQLRQLTSRENPRT